ncbi:hypothetical protein LMG8520_2096 [Lactococcus lactis subsp. lactis]|uniref:CopG family transcriptional regulator n=2 Tax=Lactococcus lactis TaxID=1358 RepID=A0A2A5S8Y4_LACLH|nr:DUF6290 family protein [Lactococcus lactis]KAA8699957.1 hypothetical protein F4V48_11095 [Lactococcus lactis subsp. hordniae]KSU06394.1 hypothetical protein LMG8520_2096 [Lactococcus lactis subsp. lactis]MCT3134440.1 hypothetical protein [Lactococcus lactis]PCS09928.1 hypothetical protein RU90_GL001623 [Lactococcus lactis subsp. hordniae]PCS09951.1 hypothetical protein RU90_GL001646 [Lactococcus lactis subsp. hordniae]
MATKQLTTIRLDEGLLSWIKELADFNGISTTKMVEEILSEKMQDEQDYLDALASIKESDGNTISHGEMMKRYG